MSEAHGEGGGGVGHLCTSEAHEGEEGGGRQDSCAQGIDRWKLS